MIKYCLAFVIVILMLPVGYAAETVSGKSKGVKKSQKKAHKKGNQTDKGRLLIGVYECMSCHSLKGQGAKEGVSLDNLNRSRDFLIEHILDPETHVERNPKSFGNEPNLMPSYQLSRKEAADIADYLLKLRNEKQKGKEKR